MKIVKILSYKEVTTTLIPIRQKALDKVMREGDWGVLVSTPIGENISEAGYGLLIGRRGGRMRVIGFAT